MPETYADPLWGAIDLGEPMLGELVSSAPVQRLKHIHQAGASYYILPEQRSGTRFEHSLGVLHVLQSLGANLEEQIAGLLHDVPHTAFSHTVDIVFPNDEHNFHERFQREIVLRSEIPATLARHHLPLRAALEPENYPLLEQPLPGLCADRIDYSLRDAFSLGKITREEAQDFLPHLLPTPQGPLVNSVAAARRFAEAFSAANSLLWTAIDEAGTYWALAGALRRAYAMHAFTDADLFSTDEAAMSKLRAIPDPLVRSYLLLLEPGTHFYEAQPPSPFFVTHMKNRAVDPLVQDPSWSTPRRLTQVDPEYKRIFDAVGLHKSINYSLWSDKIDTVLAGSLESEFRRSEVRRV